MGVGNKRKRDKSSIDHTFHLRISKKKEPHDVGLRGQTDGNSVADWGEKNHTHEEFSYPLRLRVLGRRVK